LIFALPRVFAASIDAYRQVFQFFSFLSGAGILYLTYLTAKKVNLPIGKVLVFLLFGLILIMPILLTRFDITVALLTFAGFYCWVSKSKSRSKIKIIGYMLLISAGFSKLYPFLVIPFLLIYDYKTFGYKELIKGLAACLVSAIPFLVLSVIGWGGFIDLIDYHAGRGLEIESTYASLLLVLNQLNLISDFHIIYSHASYGIAGHIASILSGISPVLFMFGLLFLMLSACKVNWSEKSAYKLIAYISASILLFIVTNKVFSTQYYVWLFPWLTLYTFSENDSKRKNLLISFFLISSFFTSLIFPFLWWHVIEEERFSIVILFARNTLLTLLFLGLFIRLTLSRELERNDVEIKSGDKVKN
jgi:hypothetical protein